MDFLGYDAQQTDGSDLSKMTALYRYRGVVVSIPATTAPEQVEAVVQAAFGLSALEAQAAAALRTVDWNAKLAAVQQAQTKLSDLQTQITAVNAASTLAAIKPPLLSALNDINQLITGLVGEAVANLKRERALLQALSQTTDVNPPEV